MTSEVVLMNRQAVAMAADSAVTISGPQYLKTYQSVDKLFPLVDGQPIAVMIYNNAEIMSTPWETVISLYREAARGRSLDTVEAYAEDFMAFLSGNPDLFPAEHQDTEFFKHIAVVMTVIAEDFDYQVHKFKEQNGARLREHISSIFEFVVGELYADYQRYPDDSVRSDLACFPSGMGEQVRRRYKNEIEQLVESLIASLKQDYGSLAVSEATRERLRDIAVLSVTKDAFFEHYTGVVFAGFGSRDKFPSMRSYLSSSVILGILKRKQDRAADMSFGRWSGCAALCAGPHDTHVPDGHGPVSSHVPVWRDAEPLHEPCHRCDRPGARAIGKPASVAFPRIQRKQHEQRAARVLQVDRQLSVCGAYAADISGDRLVAETRARRNGGLAHQAELVPAEGDALD